MMEGIGQLLNATEKGMESLAKYVFKWYTGAVSLSKLSTMVHDQKQMYAYIGS